MEYGFGGHLLIPGLWEFATTMRRDVFTEGIRHLPLSGRHLTAVLCCAVAAFVTSCGSDSDAASPPPRSAATEVAGPAEQDSISVTVPGTLAAEFAELQAGEEGQLGLAIMPVGGDRMVVLGDWTTGPAWSTMKVPLAIAASRKSSGASGSGVSTYSLTAAITASDNSAAETLWESLGTPEEAARAVEQVLREGGDQVTTVPATRSRPGYSAFGQSEWSLADQVRFASRLPCLPEAGEVVDLMEQIVSNHQWGLGSVFSAAQFKGGWGPDASGSYLVRQFGLVPATGGTIAIALAAKPDSGTFSDGLAMLNTMTDLVSEHLGELTGGRCPA